MTVTMGRIMMAGAVVLSLAGCTQARGTPQMGAPEAHAGIGSVDAAAVRLPPSPEASPVAGPTYGRAFSYGTGLTVTVSAPRRFTPSAFVHPGAGTAVRLRIELTNTTGSSFNPRQLGARVVEGGGVAEQIFDSPHGVVARPEDRLADGETVVFSVGFWVPDPDDVDLELTAGDGYQGVTIAG